MAAQNKELKKTEAINLSRDTSLANKVRIADSFFKRLRGLLFTKCLPEGDALLLTPCNSIHSLGMAYAIDAIFLDKQNQVVAILSDFKPGLFSTIYWQAHSCLELPSGLIAQTGTQVGDRLQFHV